MCLSRVIDYIYGGGPIIPVLILTDACRETEGNILYGSPAYYCFCIKSKTNTVFLQCSKVDTVYFRGE